MACLAFNTEIFLRYPESKSISSLFKNSSISFVSYGTWNPLSSNRVCGSYSRARFNSVTRVSKSYEGSFGESAFFSNINGCAEISVTNQIPNGSFHLHRPLSKDSSLLRRPIPPENPLLDRQRIPIVPFSAFKFIVTQDVRKERLLLTKEGKSYAANGSPEVQIFLAVPPGGISRDELENKDQNCRESQYRAYWLSRNQSIIDRLLDGRSSIICLQEVWLGNDELVDMYEKRLGNAGYISLKLARTNNRGDGLLTAVHRDYFRVLNYRDLLFNDFGDRVAQLLHVESVVPFWQNRHSNIQQQILIVNTHLLFPHNYSLCIVRLHQVYKILQYVESYQKEYNLNSMPTILCGDWNGSKRGHVYKFLRSQGFISSYDSAHQYTDSDADAHKWVSHRNHRGNICGVDFIWLRNPDNRGKALRASWNQAVMGILKSLLRQASLTEENAFAFLKADSPDNYITYSGFYQALCELGLTGHSDCLSLKETEELWAYADIDRDGVITYKEFQQRIWSPTLLEISEEHPKEACEESLEQKSGEVQAFGFNVKKAVLFPPEVERGTWPDNYSLSDHAPLTVVFSPVVVSCSQPISSSSSPTRMGSAVEQKKAS